MALCLGRHPRRDPWAIAEEVIFRGALPTRLRGLGLAPAAAVLLSSACFVAVHDTSDPMRIVQLAIGALALSWTVHRLDRLEFAIGAHVAGTSLSTHGMLELWTC